MTTNYTSMAFRASVSFLLVLLAGVMFSGTVFANTWTESIWFRDLTGMTLDPIEYDANSGPQKKWVQEFIGKIPFKGNEDVLDVGSGTGLESAVIASKVPQGRVVAIDSSEAMVLFGMKTYGSQHKNLVFQKADVRDLAYDQQFDIVVTSSMLHWFKDNQKAIDQLAKALKPTGKLYVRAFTNESKDAVMNKVIEKVVSEAKWKLVFKNLKQIFSTVTRYDLEALVKNAGLHIKNVQVVECKYTFKNKEELINWLMPWKKAVQTLPQVIDLPDNVYRSFVNEIVTSYLEKQHMDPDGGISFSAPMIEIEAEKRSK